MLRIYAVALMAISSQASAGAISKCVDAAGAVTFSQHGCAAGHDQKELSVQAAPRPSGTGPSVQLADPKSKPITPRYRTTYNHCGDLTQVDVAHAKAHGKIILGMTDKNVREIWGAPMQINRTADGAQWVYPIDEYRNRYLYLDNRGCFTYWN